MKSSDPNQSPGSRESGGATGGNAGERIIDAGRDAMSGATQDVRSKMERGKSTAADTAASASEVLEHAADDFSQHGQETLARATQMLAGKLSDLSGQLQNRSLDDLAQDAISLARRNPGLFVAGGVALGVALSRFFKASSPSSTGGMSETGQYRGGAAYGGEGALPSEGAMAYPGDDEIPLAGTGAPGETGVSSGTRADETFPEAGRGPARAPSSSNNPLGVGGQHE